jgi:deferrochelatase/peroxidase EfeB
MRHALVTVLAPIDAAALARLPPQIAELGNPTAHSIRVRLDALDSTDGESGTHFASLHAIPAGSGEGGHLVLEFSADGTEERALARITSQISEELEPIFSQATDWRAGDSLLAYLRGHRITVGHGLFSSPGLAHSGTPGMNVGRIRKERELAQEVTRLLAGQPRDRRAIDRLAAVRAAIRQGNTYAWALEQASAPLSTIPAVSTPRLIVQLILSFLRTYFWPIGLLLLGWSAYVAVAAYPITRPAICPAIVAGLIALAKGLLVAVPSLIVFLLALYLLLRRAETRDWVDERWPERATLAAILERENRGAQNHMLSVTRRKPGIVRWFTIRFAFWGSVELVRRVFRPGFLEEIGTIHFARWVTVPGTRDFLFFSNYDGSWESYLEDFITRAHFGLTGVWSNSIGFPRSANLIQGGASDGERFKRYARRSMQPTPFWYSAYPDLTTAHIRTNAIIRRGLAAALSDEEASDWLALFGSAARPDATLESSDIQSLVFGGLGFLRFGVCVLYALSDDREKAQKWLRELMPHVTFDDGPRRQAGAVITGAFGPRALTKLGLPEDCLSGFPAAYLDGMAARAHILGDVDGNAVSEWSWGQEPPDVAFLIYGDSAEAVAILEQWIRDLANSLGHMPIHRIPLEELTEKKTEPFGFVDGISQPAMRGTYKGLRTHDPIHLVEPGEFVLGYPDNRGNIPPGPTLSALLDPHNRLPIELRAHHDFASNIVNAVREIGRNGSFLVIRQLAQDIGAFETYCRSEAARLEDRLGPPNRIDPEFIAAKLVGRWRNGSSLVRHPYAPARYGGTGEDPNRPVSRPKSNPEGKPAIEAPGGPSARADNDFLFGDEDPEALRCPFSAHIRRANPRDSFDPGSRDQIDISNRHRLLRVGRPYRPNANERPGLLFMCLNGDIERQFEFIQQTWLGSPSFHGLFGEEDPITGGSGNNTGFLIPSRDGPVRLHPLPRFVTTLGGGYFFLPGKRLWKFLGGDE